jgi:hypothetical protein
MRSEGFPTIPKKLKSCPNCADKSDMDLSAIALQGLQQADAQLNSAATRIASAGTHSPDGANLDVVDLSGAVIAMMSAKTLASANLATLKTATEVDQSVIDLMA